MIDELVLEDQAFMDWCRAVSAKAWREGGEMWPCSKCCMERGCGYVPWASTWVWSLTTLNHRMHWWRVRDLSPSSIFCLPWLIRCWLTTPFQTGVVFVFSLVFSLLWIVVHIDRCSLVALIMKQQVPQRLDPVLSFQTRGDWRNNQVFWVSMTPGIWFWCSKFFNRPDPDKIGQYQACLPVALWLYRFSFLL